MKAIYEESCESYEEAPDGVSVTVLKAEYHDAPRTPRYLVLLSTFKWGERILKTVGHGETVRSDANVIRWAQAEYDRQKAIWASATRKEVG